MKKELVRKIPVETLVDERDGNPLNRLRDLSSEDIRELLRQGPVRFVIANVGRPLRWIPAAETFSFWKNEASAQIADASAGSGKILNKDKAFRDFVYVPSEWQSSSGPVVLLEMYH